MKSNPVFARLWKTGCALSLISAAAFAAPPVIKTVPWVASNPLLPHTTFVAKQVTLKGTCDQQGANLTWRWDFGDGSAVATGTVSDMYVVEAKHVYSGAVGTIYTARLTVQNTTTGETGNKVYYVQMLDKTLETEVNVAIDEGLWYLHKNQRRSGSLGDWTANNGKGYGGYASLWAHGVSVANLNAFEVNGHLESGSSENPYVETVQRAMRSLFSWLAPISIGIQNPESRNPDTNVNGIGVVVGQGYSYYQGGMFMDAIVASGTPSAVTTTGPAKVVGRTYKDVLQDMVDAYAWSQYDGNTGYPNYTKLGGWRYNANEWPDNSACQWAAIGVIAAERNWGCIVPAWVKDWNIPWLRYTQAADGSFGYTNTSGVGWGPYASTPSGMVQMVMDGIGRGTVGTNYPSWEKSETFLRDRFGNVGGATNAIKDYYYGLFSFVKSMLLHNGAGGPIVMLHSQTPGVADLDWYKAEASKGAPTDGVARTLVGDQNVSAAHAGYWWQHNYSGDQYPFETAWAIMMLHQTLFESGIPVAVAKAVPNPAVVGQIITLDGSDSYHQNPSRHIVKWEWDLGNGVFVEGPAVIQTSFGALGNWPIKLRVTDDSGASAPTAQTTVTVVVSTPPLAPTADADGPYHYCASISKWFLDGRNSRNPDEGQHQAGNYPGDTIREYAWDLDGDNDFNDAFGPTPDMLPFFTAQNMGVGAYIVSLRVTDTTSQSYPASNMPDLVSTASTIVYVDLQCLCTILSATPVLKGVQLDWTAYAGANSYNVYRSSDSGGPYTWIQRTAALSYTDLAPGPLDQKYYYVVRPAYLNGDEICQSNEAYAEPLHPVPVATCVTKIMSNTGKYYYTVDALSEIFGHMQLGLYVGDAGSPQVVGPLPPGCVVYIRTNLGAASVRAGSGSVERYIMTKGKARVWAQDPLGQKSVELVVQ